MKAAFLINSIGILEYKCKGANLSALYTVFHTKFEGLNAICSCPPDLECSRALLYEHMVDYVYKLYFNCFCLSRRANVVKRLNVKFWRPKYM